MLQRSLRSIETIPVGPLGIIPLQSCAKIGEEVDKYLVNWRHANTSEHKSSIIFSGYEKDSSPLRTRPQKNLKTYKNTPAFQTEVFQLKKYSKVN